MCVCVCIYILVELYCGAAQRFGLLWILLHDFTRRRTHRACVDLQPVQQRHCVIVGVQGVLVYSSRSLSSRTSLSSPVTPVVFDLLTSPLAVLSSLRCTTCSDPLVPPVVLHFSSLPLICSKWD